MTSGVGDYLKREFKKRREVNSRYSLRAFANYLGISPAYLSQVMSGKYLISEIMLLKIQNKLRLNNSQVKRLRSSLKNLKEMKRRTRRRNLEN